MQSAEAAIWNEARLIEKERVEELHEQQRLKGKVSSSVYRPEEVKKPWIWGSSAAHSLHDLQPRLVDSVKEFDYDLDDLGFVDFLRSRSHLHMCHRENSAFWNALERHRMTKEEFLADPSFHFAQEYQARRHRYTTDELAGEWKIMRYTKGFLQGAYDRFIGREERRPGIRQF